MAAVISPMICPYGLNRVWPLGIIVRYNLLNSGLAGPKLSFFCGVIAPWLITMFCYQASVLTAICK